MVKQFIATNGCAIMTGDLGGWVESRKNLSQNGSCWIFHPACICDNAKVTEGACINKIACISDNATISGYAYVCGNVSGNAFVGDHVYIDPQSSIKDDAEVYGFTRVISSNISGDTCIGKFVTGKTITTEYIVEKQEISCQGDCETYPVSFISIGGGAFPLTFTKNGIFLRRSFAKDEKDIAYLTKDNEENIGKKERSEYNIIDYFVLHILKNSLSKISKQYAAYFVEEVLGDSIDGFIPVKSIYRYIFSRLASIMVMYSMLTENYKKTGSDWENSPWLREHLIPWLEFTEKLFNSVSVDVFSGEILSLNNVVLLNDDLLNLATSGLTPSQVKIATKNFNNCSNFIELPSA